MKDKCRALEGLSKPRVSVEFDGFSPADLWFLMARAFADCSAHLLLRMAQREIASGFHHAKAAISLGEHALELFLKGGIAQSGEDVPTHHRLDDLYERFHRLYSDVTFEASVPVMIRPRKDFPYNQFARYPTDLQGRPWTGLRHIDVADWYRQVCLLANDFERIQP